MGGVVHDSTKSSPGEVLASYEAFIRQAVNRVE